MRLFLLTCLMGLSLSAFSQDLPPEMYLSPDGHRLYTGGQPASGLYDESIIRTINLDFSQSNYWTLLTQNYASHTDIPATMTVDGVVYDSVGVRFKGQTSYQMVQNSQKKSFNISLDYGVDYDKLMGYKTLNLNNCFLDPSFLREFFYLHQIRNHIPAAKASFVKLYLNNQYWGIYPSVQQLNGDFYEEWFLSNNGTNWRADRPNGTTGGPGGPGGGGGWGDGTAALNYLGADTALYKQYYTLKSTDKANPWDDLVVTCEVLENTPLDQLESTLADYMDLDRTLWFLACEIAFTDDDSYVYKGKMDYYVYWEPETGRMTPIEYDGNSCMELNFAQQWTPFYHANNVNYPLLNRLLAVPSLRQRYLAHLRTIVEESFDPATAEAAIDAYAAQIDSLVQTDPKKIYTYNQFLTEVADLKEFLSVRRTYLLNNTEMAQVAPTIAGASHFVAGIEWGQPDPNQEATVRASVSSTNGIDRVTLYYATGLVGNFSKTSMYDDGQHDDGAAGDGVFAANIPAQAGGQWVRYYVEAAAANTAKSVRYFPAGAEHDVMIYKVLQGAAASTDIVINELLASNETTATDEAGEFDDWIELYNNGTAAVDISGWIITDNPANLDKWDFPTGTVIQPGDYLILWADEDSSQGPLHANFKLSASGEELILLDASGAVVDQVTFGVQDVDMSLSRIPNGTGSFVVKNPTFGYNNEQASGADDLSVGEPSIRLMPNPAEQQLRIQLPDTYAGTVEIYDVLGKRWFAASAQPELLIELANWPAGAYAVKCGGSVKMLVKQ
ncbi:MAG: CotH kinase family protein [Saprospiraceae bacterium]|nr:CotH kinase family protein [Saprospiraceae bacterium]